MERVRTEFTHEELFSFYKQVYIYTCNACVHTMRLILARNGARSTGLAQLVYSQSVNHFFYLSICRVFPSS